MKQHKDLLAQEDEQHTTAIQRAKMDLEAKATALEIEMNRQNEETLALVARARGSSRAPSSRATSRAPSLAPAFVDVPLSVEKDTADSPTRPDLAPESVSEKTPVEEAEVKRSPSGSSLKSPEEPKSPLPSQGKKVKPNDPCPCDNGKKYKKCHGSPSRSNTPVTSPVASPKLAPNVDPTIPGESGQVDEFQRGYLEMASRLNSMMNPNN